MSLPDDRATGCAVCMVSNEQIKRWNTLNSTLRLRRVRFDRSHFKGYGDFALLFETVYWVTEPDYKLYMDIQQKINFDLFRRFEAEGIEFAHPTQTINLSAGQKVGKPGIPG